VARHPAKNEGSDRKKRGLGKQPAGFATLSSLKYNSILVSGFSLMK
jgi:hypothetical protein